MHSVVITGHFQPGKRAEAVELWKQHLAAADEANQDIVQLTLVLDDDDADKFRLVEFYTSPKGFDDVMQSPEVAGFIGAVGEWFASPPEFLRGTPIWGKAIDISIGS